MLGPQDAPYRLVFLGERGLADSLEQAVREQARERLGVDAIDFGREVSAVDQDPTSATGHIVVIVCVGTQTLESSALEQIRVALTSGIAVLPVLVGASAEALPDELAPINAMRWDEEPEAVTIWILRLLGLAEEDRRVFLSYKRDDTLALADQLRRGLADHGFDVFLDRFSVAPAEDFQRRLELDLSDKAFVLLLESPEAHSSQWVNREVAFALSHNIGVFSLATPGVRRGQLFSAVPEAMRRRLEASELTQRRYRRTRELTEPALRDVLWDIEWRYAERLRRHRQQLVDTLTDWLRATGHTAVAGPEWTVLASKETEKSLFLVTPRAPTPRDLLKAHQQRELHDADALAVVAHNPDLIDEDLASLNTWVADGRNLETRVHGTLRDWLFSK